MAHFAQLDENNIVVHVSVLADENCQDEFGFEQESIGISFLKQVHGENTNWKQTSYNSNIRKKFAGIGDTYDSERDAFISPKPYASWSLNEETCDWEAPSPRPEGNYLWNEESQTWVDMSL